jgi:hypothetical protein
MALERVASLLELSEAAVKKRLPGAGFSEDDPGRVVTSIRNLA